jgi:hypothetical protein
MRGAQQRRCSGPLRPACGAMVDCDAHIFASWRGRISGENGPGSRRTGPARSACEDKCGILNRCRCDTSRESGAAAASAGARSNAPREERGSMGHVLCDQYRSGPAGHVLSLCIRADVVLRLPSACSLDRWLLRGNQHGRRRDSEARLYCRSQEYACGPTRHRTVHCR